MAMVNQYMLAQSDVGPQGNANYVLYPLASQQINAGTQCASAAVTSGNACTFYDITEGNNSVPCTAGTPNCSASTFGTIGVLVDGDGNIAWSAGPGYDLATGLGSINVANLVRNWPAAVGSFEPTATTLQLCSGTPQVCVSGGAAGNLVIAHGAAVNVNVSVSPTPPGSGTPTGDAALIGTPNTLSNSGGSPSTGAIQFAGLQDNGVISLSQGKASITTNSLVGGSYQVRAHYTGDGTFGASDSSPVNITVTSESSATSLTLLTTLASQSTVSLPSGQSIGYGTPVILHIGVSSTNSVTQATPTGQLTVYDNGSPFDGGTFTLNNEGFAEIQTGLGPLPALAVGQHSFQASYGGDNSYAGSQTIAGTSLLVTPATTNLTVTSSPVTVLAGSTVTLAANVTAPTSAVGGVGAAPTGTVTFYSNGTAVTGQLGSTPTSGAQSGLGQPEIAASWTETLAYKPTATGTITATYSGDANYLSSSGTDATVLPLCRT